MNNPIVIFRRWRERQITRRLVARLNEEARARLAAFQEKTADSRVPREYHFPGYFETPKE